MNPETLKVLNATPPPRNAAEAATDPKIVRSSKIIGRMENALGGQAFIMDLYAKNGIFPATDRPANLSMLKSQHEVLTREWHRQRSAGTLQQKSSGAGGYPEPHIRPAQPVVAAPPAPATPPVQTTSTSPAAAFTLSDFLALDAAGRKLFAEDGRTLPLSVFDSLSPKARASFCKAGGKIHDDRPPLAKSFGGAPADSVVTTARKGKTISRSDFENLTPTQQAAHCRAGGIIN